MSDRNDAERELNRRSILRTVGATGAAMVGITGATGAMAREGTVVEGVPRAALDQRSDEEVRAYREYAGDEAMVRQAFDEHIDSVARMIKPSDISVPSSLDEAADVTIFPESRDGQASAHIVARFENDRELFVHIYPQAEQAHAHVGRGEETRLFSSDGEVEPQGCYESYECECPSACGWYDGYETVYNVCQLPDGTNTKERIGGHCGCDDAPNPCTVN